MEAPRVRCFAAIGRESVLNAMVWRNKQPALGIPDTLASCSVKPNTDEFHRKANELKVIESRFFKQTPNAKYMTIPRMAPGPSLNSSKMANEQSEQLRSLEVGNGQSEAHSEPVTR
jgi:hypothetical protein